MRKTISLAVIAILFFITKQAKAQMQPADSLTGTYAGKYWYANPSTNPWTITADTEYITSVDTVNCILYGNGPLYYTPGAYYCTNYYSCNTSTYTCSKLKFYNGDSIRAIYDNNLGGTAPNTYWWSQRFYGKRISNKTVGINEIKNNSDIYIYPNPVNGILTIKYKMPDGEVQLKITDEIGKEVKSQKLRVRNEKTTIDVTNLNKGVYFVQITTQQGIVTKKIIIN